MRPTVEISADELCTLITVADCERADDNLRAQASLDLTFQMLKWIDDNVSAGVWGIIRHHVLTELEKKEWLI